MKCAVWVRGAVRTALFSVSNSSIQISVCYESGGNLMIVKKSYLKDRTYRMIESDKDVKRWINNLMLSPFKSLINF